MAASSCIPECLPSNSPMFTASGSGMERSGGNCTQGWVINPTRWVDEWRRIHPVKPAQCVADRIRAPVRTVEKWFTGESRPSFDWFGPILNAYGLSFVVAGMASPAPWLDDAAREERRRALLEQRQAIDAQLAEHWQRRIGA